MVSRVVLTRWEGAHEVDQSRKVRGPLTWVALPTRQGRGYCRLVAKHGAAGLGVWVALVELAAMKPRDERGYIDGTLEDVAMLARLPVEEVEAVAATLASGDVGWIRLESPDNGRAPTTNEQRPIANEQVTRTIALQDRTGQDRTGQDLLSASADLVTPEWLVEAWNQTCGIAGQQMARLPLGAARRRKIAGALKAMEASKESIRQALMACAADRHWCGSNDRGWRGSLESFLRPDHRDRWLDAGAEAEGGESGSLEALARQEAARTGKTEDEILRAWGAK